MLAKIVSSSSVEYLHGLEEENTCRDLQILAFGGRIGRVFFTGFKIFPQTLTLIAMNNYFYILGEKL